MKILFTNDGVTYITESNDKNHFFFKDDLNGDNEVLIDDDLIIIKRVDDDHSTTLNLGKESYILIKSIEGAFKIDIKYLEINKNSDNIDIVYSIENQTRKIQVVFLGETHEY